MALRNEHYENKISGDARKILYDAQKPAMVEKEATAARDLVKIELEVKKMIDSEPVFLQHFYMAFAKQIYKLKKKHTDEALLNELVILETIWRDRGLNVEVLDEIKLYYVPLFQKIINTYCRFDIGLFDTDLFG